MQRNPREVRTKKQAKKISWSFIRKKKTPRLFQKILPEEQAKDNRQPQNKRS